MRSRLTELLAVAYGLPYHQAAEWLADYRFPPSSVEWHYLREQIAAAVADRHGILTVG